jgi:hypothetical protein
LFPTRTLSLIDLTGNFEQPDDIDPFDDLEWFFRGLMNSSRPHVYRYCRRIAQTIRDMTGADGFVYKSNSSELNNKKARQRCRAFCVRDRC